MGILSVLPSSLELQAEDLDDFEAEDDDLEQDPAIMKALLDMGGLIVNAQRHISGRGVLTKKVLSTSELYDESARI
ncbi:unnamed protein product [Amoebophrya sp. A25]|nr:unnamed protein product [Amoebophrya sp. A25]|eukprot:GSA25T00021562001.1